MKKLPLVVALVLAGGGLLWWAQQGRSSGYDYETAQVTRGPLRVTVSATGTINPVTTVQVGSQVSGTIQQLFADYNSVVRAGEPVAQIDPSKFQAELERTEAERLRAEATLADAERTLRRMKALHAQGLIAQAELDTADTNAKLAAAHLRQATAQRDFAKVNVDYTTITSPVDGIVIARNVDVGQTVAASLQAPTLFLIAKDLTRMQIDTDVDEADIGGVREGQAVLFTVDAYPGEEFRGTILQVRNAPIIEEKVVKYNVVVGIDNRDLKFKPGMTANVSIITVEREDVLMVPNAALRFRPPDIIQEGRRPAAPVAPWGEATVWVLERGKPVERAITKGVANDQYTEVVTGLAEGQRVISNAKPRKREREQRNPFGTRLRM